MVGPPSAWSCDQKVVAVPAPTLNHAPHRSAILNFIFDHSLLLLAGTVIAVAWANVDLASYDRVAHPLHCWAATPVWCSSARGHR